MKAAAPKTKSAPPAEAAPIVSARLFSKTGTCAGLAFQITSERPVTVGRTQGANLIVPDRLVSREHARILFEDGRFVLENIEATNGTFLNGAQMDREPLEHLDVVGFGPNSDFIFALDSSAGSGDRKRPVAGIVLLPTDASGNPIQLPLGTATLGRAEGNTVVIEQKAVSSQHARLLVGEAEVEVEDLGSANGTTVNERRVSGKLRLQEGDVLVLGKVASFVVQIQRQPEAGMAPPPAAGYRLVGEEDSIQLLLPPEAGHYVIGRESSCALILENKKSVSRRHAELELDADGRMKVRDLASGNGTMVNGVKIREAPLQVGDELQIGLVVLRVEARS